MTTYLCPGAPDAQEGPKQVSSIDMKGRWTFHAYRISHDGGTTIIHHEDGVEVVQGERRKKVVMDLRMHNPRNFMFHPDNTKVAFWAPIEEGDPNPRKRIAVMDLRRLDGKAPFEVAYSPEDGHSPFGLEWSPAGDALYVIEMIERPGGLYTAIQRIEYPGKQVTTLVERLGGIDFFMPPVSRFENGAGPSKEPFRIVFGAEDGLYLVGPDASSNQVQRASTLPAVGLHNVEWNPDPRKEQLALYFRNSVPAQDGRIFVGVYLVHVDRLKGGEEDEDCLEQLYDRTDVHTLWFSPRGTYVTWASPGAVFFRRPDAPPAQTVQIRPEPPAEGPPLAVRGVTWRHDEKQLAYTAGGGVFVYDVQANEAVQVATFPAGFAAEPVWVGDRIFLTVFEDVKDEMEKLRNTPVFTLPGVREDPNLGGGRGAGGRR